MVPAASSREPINAPIEKRDSVRPKTKGLRGRCRQQYQIGRQHSEVGAATQAIEVQAAAVQLQTEDAKNSVTLQNKLVDDLPLVVNGSVRTPFDLASLAPDAKNLGGDNGFAVGGGQAASYGTSLDGVSTNTSRALSKSWVATNSPSVEAIEQFTVDSNGYKAEYGHAGAGIWTSASKSGTNQYHGSAYEFLRNNAFDANNFFNNSAAKFIPISIYKQNDFGATIGGPIWIPKVYRGKDKSFFFFSYEGFRNRPAPTARSSQCRHRRCITATSASGSHQPAFRFRYTTP